MKKLVLLICLMLFLGTTAWGNGFLDQLQLTRQNDEVVLKIDVSGKYQYRHEIAEAKDGKPYRIVIDLFPVIHNLPKKDFAHLPPSVITALRTSQYAVKPTATTRVVLDVKESLPYRIEKKDQAIWVYVPYKGTAAFAKWSSGRNTAKKTVPGADKVNSKAPEKKSVTQSSKEQPARIKDQPQNKPEAAPTATVMPESEPAKEGISPPKYSYTRPESSSVFEKDMKQPEEKTEPKKETKPAKKKDAESKDVLKDDPFENQPKKVLTQQDASEKKEYKKVKKSDVAQKPVQNKSLVKSDVSADADKKTAQASEKKADNVKETSHFRRKPAFPAKLKGTIVAEFPTRMVIKYKPKALRDPFASLITNEASDAQSPMQPKILDVETSRLVGILESVDGKNRALLEDIDGYGYIVATGDKVKKGYVSKIYSDRALFQLFEYGWSRTVALRLNEGK
jgi:hypothetical protein